MTEENLPSLHQALLDAGCTIGIAGTDLYVLDRQDAVDVLRRYPKPANAWSFTSSNTGKHWFALPGKAEPNLGVRLEAHSDNVIPFRR